MPGCKVLDSNGYHGEWFVPVALSLYFPSICANGVSVELDAGKACVTNTYGSRGGLLVAGLASDLEGNAVGGGVLELEGGGSEVVEILVEELLAVEVSNQQLTDRRKR